MLQEIDTPEIYLTDISYDTDNGIGSRANIGLLVLQTDQTIEEEFRQILPDGVALYNSRLKSPEEIAPAKLALMEGEIPCATGLLPAIPFSSIGFGCTSGALVIGEDQVKRKVHEVLPEASVTDPVTAAIAALQALKAERVAVLTPYSPDITLSLRSQFQQRGLSIPVLGTFNQPDDYVVAKITADAIMAAILKLGRSDLIDAVFVSCTSLRVAEVIAKAESQLNKPVTSSNHAMAWHMLRLAGIDDVMPQHGKLFEV
ncbi:Asp/Glu racemase [Roseovarius pacificus]|uniref:maleate cis-trans isomerase family protein n=1 Tax=Roseovarius pacificus TaxID=337701 RepID=UPI002A188408|nr:Asp/Glu racemase [Roseovarius pacificus]